MEFESGRKEGLYRPGRIQGSLYATKLIQARIHGGNQRRTHEGILSEVDLTTMGGEDGVELGHERSQRLRWSG